MQAFKLTDVTRAFPDFHLGPISLQLDPGVALGYIGPNGSGKTTTMHCLMGLLEVTSGEIEILGCRSGSRRPHRKRDVGYVGDVHAFYERWTGEQNLEFRSRYYPNWSHQRAIELSDRFQLPLHRRAMELSSGNRAKLSLVAALSHSPELLILDEPAAGIDPAIRSEVVDVLFELLAEGRCAVLYATHHLTEISRLVDQVAFLDDGRIISQSAKDDLTDRWRRISFSLPGRPGEFPGAVSVCQEGTAYQLISSDGEVTLARLGELNAEGVHENRMTLEEIAIQIMKEGRRKNHVVPDI